MYAESVEIPRSGFAGAVTVTPFACSSSITPFQLDASAKAPCTSTTVGSVCDGGMEISFRVSVGALVVSTEEREQQEEDVEDVEEDRRGEEWSCPDVLRAPQSLEVERGQACEDHEPENRVDQ